MKKKKGVPIWKQKLRAQKKAKKNKVVEIRVAIILMIPLIAVLFLFSSKSYQIAFDYDSIKFDNTEAEVIKAEVERKIANTSKSSNVSYDAEVSYSYTVKKRVYRSSRLSLISQRESFNSKIEANEYLSNYPVGRKINIFYDVDDPSFSVIALYGQYSSFVVYIVYILAIFIYLIGIIYFYRKLDEGEKKKVFGISS